MADLGAIPPWLEELICSSKRKCEARPSISRYRRKVPSETQPKDRGGELDQSGHHLPRGPRHSGTAQDWEKS